MDLPIPTGFGHLTRPGQIDHWAQAWGLPVADPVIRRRIGEMLAYRERRDAHLNAAKFARSGGDSAALARHLAMARTQRPVVLRHLRALRREAATRNQTAHASGNC